MKQIFYSITGSFGLAMVCLGIGFLVVSIFSPELLDFKDKDLFISTTILTILGGSFLLVYSFLFYKEDVEDLNGDV